ncbi:ubiquinone anaerobic biosynthesis protein UbiU [Rhodovibrionaceae bacterium A322]
MELVCPAGTPAALRTAVLAGADAIYCGFRNETNARNFPGLNFSEQELTDSIAFAHDEGAKVLVALNTFAQAGKTDLWKRSADAAVEAGADALILADLGLLDYCQDTHPSVRRHLSVQAAAANADSIAYYQREFGIRRVVLPRVLTVPEIMAINKETDCETEVFVFGGLCVMAEGRCSLSSYCTGKSPNMNGVCSPPSHVRYEERDGKLHSLLGDITINQFDVDEPAAYPTLCKGRFQAEGRTFHIFEDPVSLNAAQLLPQLKAAGVTALKIEGRQRGKAYMAQVVQSFRSALDALEEGRTEDLNDLLPLMEGQKGTGGAYRKTWR